MKTYGTALVRRGLILVMVAMGLFAAVELSAAKSISTRATPKLLADYKAANYQPKTGTWTDSSRHHDRATVPTGASPPTLVAKTAKGPLAVSFDGKDQYMKMFKGIQSDHGYTVVAFVEPLRSNARVASAVVAGGPGSLEYRIQTMSDGQSKQVLLKTATVAFGASNSSVPTNVFSTIAVTANDTGNGNFYLNGNPDGTFSGSSRFSQPVVFIGAAATGPGATPAEFFRGDIAELRVYSGVLSPRRIKALTASFTKMYGGNH